MERVGHGRMRALCNRAGSVFVWARVAACACIGHGIKKRNSECSRTCFGVASETDCAIEEFAAAVVWGLDLIKMTIRGGSPSQGGKCAMPPRAHATLMQMFEAEIPHLRDIAAVGLCRHRPPCVQPHHYKHSRPILPRTVPRYARQQRPQTSTGRSQPARRRRFSGGAALSISTWPCLPPRSATHMHTATAGPRPFAAAWPCRPAPPPGSAPPQQLPGPAPPPPPQSFRGLSPERSAQTPTVKCPARGGARLLTAGTRHDVRIDGNDVIEDAKKKTNNAKPRKPARTEVGDAWSCLPRHAPNRPSRWQ